VAEEDFDRAVGYADTALELLKRSGIPPYPQFYELLFTYATGVNPTLNQHLNSLFRSGTALSEAAAQSLYNEFLKANVQDRMSSVSERMNERIDAMHLAIETAMNTAHAYSGSLESVTDDLENDASESALKALAARLLAETRHMQDTNTELERKLESSRDDIASLQRDLDDVRRESLLDPLTKIANRKRFEQELANAIETADGGGAPFCLMLSDIDHFKTFNDTFGHQTGDQVLRLVAMTLKSNIRSNDLAARFGGEEFAAILPSTNLIGATIAAENIRRAVHAKELLKRSTNEKLGRITASFGIAEYRRGETAAALIERADRCLYAAKSAGRNKVISETDLPSAESASAA
jgi:diguanylate cyclase